MDGQRIATTRLDAYRALAVGGQAVNRAWTQIAGYLRDSLSPAHAALFAEPSIDAVAGTVDWYAADGAPPVPLADRPGLPARLDELVAAVRDRAAALQQSSLEGERLLGAVLAAALEVPGQEHLWAVGEQPVLVAWGNRSREPGARGVLLRDPGGVGRSASAAGIIAAAPASERWKTWAGLIGVLLLAALALWGLPHWFGLPSPICRVEARESRVLDAEKAREAALRQQLAALRARKAQQCAAAGGIGSGGGGGGGGGSGGGGGGGAAAAPPPENPPPNPAEPTADDRKRVENQGGKSGVQQVTLGWDDENDLDLMVECPDGKLISFLPAERANCGGALDLDANKDDGGVRRDPVENIVWVEDAPPGRYRVFVRFHKQRAKSPMPYRITIRVRGEPDRQVGGSIAANETRKPVAEFTVPGRS